MLASELVAAVKSEGGFDVTDLQALGWVNQRYREAVATARWREASVSLGVTVIGQSVYALADRVVEVHAVKVGSAPYSRIGAQDLWYVRSGVRRLRGPGGIFAPSYDEDGAKGVDLQPVPDTAGVEITALAAVEPVDLTVLPDLTPIIPSDLHGGLIDGGIAIGLERLDERLQDAAVFKAKFDDMVERLRRRKNSRVGAGPVQIQIAGKHF